MNVDTLIVGAGFSGSVIARLLADNTKQKILVIDSRDHIGGNSYDYINQFGIRISKYGAHLFHTDRQEVWNFISAFGSWEPWEHRVLAKVYPGSGNDIFNYVPIPVCIQTIQNLYDPSVQNEDDMKRWLDAETKTIKVQPPYKNSMESAVARFGYRIYNDFFYSYTLKQWDKPPECLDASVLQRIPLRYNNDDRYFTDSIQMLPSCGYKGVFEHLLDHPQIEVRLNTDYFQERHCFNGINCTVFTGPIDGYFASRGLDRLEYRSIHFDEFTVTVEETDAVIQPASVVNEPSMRVPYTRTVEYKQFLNQRSYYSTLVREYSTSHGDPYYPVPNERNMKIYSIYQQLAERETEKERRIVLFLGRLANYKYLNMDQAIGNALDNWQQWTKEGLIKIG
ncbi:hypothetical protein CHS0354_014902 [Potamilus streckersoni]|uniref:UDP-galactopyranose mutase C-terminal domain-containing protein n=1 Tax=Potamilus streckersoni TaxID=2493646 RepID=A0AAE0SHL4_9BIVA|nr:hypothetical protein CHS0354_014902 [Potamilus streckersoni]